MWGRAKSDPASRFRLAQYIKPLENEGHQVTFVTPTPQGNWRCSLRIPSFLFWGYVYFVRLIQVLSVLALVRKARRYDVVMMNRDILPFLKTPWLEEMLVRNNPNLVFDFDDAIYLNSPETKIARICELAKLVTAGNARLKEFASRYSPNVRVLPTVADTDAVRPREKCSGSGFRVGWIGSDDSYLHSFSSEIRKAICDFAAGHGATICIMKETAPDRNEWPGVNVEFVKWSLEAEMDLLSKIDVGIMPVKDDEFQRAKCGGKIVLYMAAGLPVIASPVGVNKTIVKQGTTGLLAETPIEWIFALEELLFDEEIRRKMGGASREFGVMEYSVKSTAPALMDILSSSEGSGRC